MKSLAIFIFSLLISFAGDELFMTEYDYAKMLYFEPNGISCASCHGENGQGNLVFEYVVYQKSIPITKIVPVKNLHSLSFLDFIHGIEEKNRFMPTYRLSRTELTSIYFYIQKRNGSIPSADTKLLKFYNDSMREKETTPTRDDSSNRKNN